MHRIFLYIYEIESAFHFLLAYSTETVFIERVSQKGYFW